MASLLSTLAPNRHNHELKLLIRTENKNNADAIIDKQQERPG
jgi:hypothetical protein